MAALTTDRDTPSKGARLVSLPVAASAKIYAGSIVAVNASGYAVPGSATATLKVAGRANELADNSAGANGAISVLVGRDEAYLWDNATAGDAVVQANMFRSCYVLDDNTVAGVDGSGARPVAGTVVGIDSAGVWVKPPVI
ncbi:hypothetical protein [Desulforegula conservatrix]|uniref:hypothetical protein n=1 Tax=Desulforegula conservatrix TaxID=153026 RepID=UPI00042895C3|nr:hypothetical protein [Desulforegula conservatrix]